MKKAIFLFAASIIVLATQAQSERFVKAMQANLAAMDTTRTPQGYQDLANSFVRIAEAEKTQWLPYYYASLSYVMQGLMLSGGQMGTVGAITDPLADKAEGLLIKAMDLEKENSEMYCVKKMIANLRMMADPMNRYQTEGANAAQALEKAKALDPANPRTSILEAQDKFYTPEQYGGSKAEAKTLFEEAVKKFETFKPASPIHPNWGKDQAMYFLSQLK